MPNELMLLLKSEKDKVLKVLKPQVRHEILKYLTGGFFDDEGKRFVAYALMPVNKTYFDKYAYLFDNFEQGYQYQLSAATNEKAMKFADETKTTFQHKSIKECIEDGLFRYNVVSFLGEFDFNEWNILRSSRFTDEKNITQIFDNEYGRIKEPIKNYYFRQSIFEETETRYRWLMTSVTKREEMPLPTEMKPYIGHSHLVQLVRLEQKRKINGLYENYIKATIFEPLITKLKTNEPIRYENTEAFFWLDRCEMLYPDQKQFCMFLFFTFTEKKAASLNCIIYNQHDNRLYEWDYFPPKLYSYHSYNAEKIIDLFKPISKCDSIDYLSNVECTLDDDNFWNDYVFEKEDGRFLYLKEIGF